MAAARMGQQTLLLTHNIDTLGQMSCNPAIGGIGKGHLVKEVDALGGLMAKAIDQAGIQFRILNASKGPAVRATRAQADRVLYRQAVRTALENQPNLMIFQQAVEDLIVENDCVVGAVTQMGLKFVPKPSCSPLGRSSTVKFISVWITTAVVVLVIRRPFRSLAVCVNCRCALVV